MGNLSGTLSGPLSGPLSGGLTTDLNNPGGEAPPLETLNNGLVSYYDNSGTDRKGSNNLTAFNAPGTGVGKVTATCMDFERGFLQRYQLASASAADFQPNQTQSIAFWMKAENLADFLIIHSKTVGSDGRTYTEGSQALTSQWGGASIVTPAIVFAGAWLHIYTHWDNATNTLYRSIDNGTLDSDVGTGAASNVTDFQLGGQNNVGSLFFDGLIDQFCLWHRPLTTLERDALYNAGAGVDFLIP
jgi:hypothetical protein